jgi:general secretion pathway protein G
MNAYRNHSRKSGFTLVEILIVVIILGILAAIIIPQFTNASTTARANSTVAQLQTLRSQIQLFKLQHNDALPSLVADQWAPLLSTTNVTGTVDSSSAGIYGPYLQTTPANPLNNYSEVAAAAGPSIGWVYTLTTGQIQATNQTSTLIFNESTGVVQ